MKTGNTSGGKKKKISKQMALQDGAGNHQNTEIMATDSILNSPAIKGKSVHRSKWGLMKSVKY